MMIIYLSEKFYDCPKKESERCLYYQNVKVNFLQNNIITVTYKMIDKDVCERNVCFLRCLKEYIEHLVLEIGECTISFDSKYFEDGMFEVMSSGNIMTIYFKI